MSSFTKDEIDALMVTDNIGMLNSALVRLNEEIPRVQEMYENAVEDGEKTEDYRLSVAILRGTKAGLEDHGLSAGVGLMPLRELKREIKNYLKSLPEVRTEVKEVLYGEPPVPSPKQAADEQDFIEDSMNRAAEKKDPVLREMKEIDYYLTQIEEKADEAIFNMVEEEHVMKETILQQLIADEHAIKLYEEQLKKGLVNRMVNDFRKMITALVGIN